MTRLEKLAIAHQLAKLRVDVIKAGFPASSKYDWETVKLIAKEVGSRVDKCSYVPVISAYCRNLGAQNITFACEDVGKSTFGSGDSRLQLVNLSFNQVSGVVPATIGVFKHINSPALLPAESPCREWTLRLRSECHVYSGKARRDDGRVPMQMC
ncbi:hypothetical protein TB2_040796 [Malus domestica]